MALRSLSFSVCPSVGALLLPGTPVLVLIVLDSIPEPPLFTGPILTVTLLFRADIMINVTQQLTVIIAGLPLGRRFLIFTTIPGAVPPPKFRGRCTCRIRALAPWGLISAIPPIVRTLVVTSVVMLVVPLLPMLIVSTMIFPMFPTTALKIRVLPRG